MGYRIILKLFTIIILLSCVKHDERVKDITIEELKLVLKDNNNIQLLDVRTTSEAAEGIIFDAKQVNLISNSFEQEAIDVLDKTQPVYVYCRSGRRSKIAANVLVENGYEVYNVKGGYLEWEKKNKDND